MLYIESLNKNEALDFFLTQRKRQLKQLTDYKIFQIDIMPVFKGKT